MTAETDTDVSGAPGLLTSEPGKQKCWGRVNEAEVTCVQSDTGKGKPQGGCMLGPVSGLLPRGCARKRRQKGRDNLELCFRAHKP